LLCPEDHVGVVLFHLQACGRNETGELKLERGAGNTLPLVETGLHSGNLGLAICRGKSVGCDVVSNRPGARVYDVGVSESVLYIPPQGIAGNGVEDEGRCLARDDPQNKDEDLKNAMCQCGGKLQHSRLKENAECTRAASSQP